MNRNASNWRAMSLRWLGVVAIGVGLAGCSSGTGTSATSAPAAATTTRAAAPAATSANAAATTAAKAAATTAAAPAASGPGDEAGVTFAEFSLAGTSSVKAGKVKFQVSNSGMLPHNLHIVKSDLAIDKLPDKDGQVDLSKLDVVLKTNDILEGGEDVHVEATLAPGKYVMFCNVVGHYQLGMRKQLTVN